MPVLLRHSNDLPAPAEYKTWFAVTGTTPLNEPDRKLPGLAMRLEEAFVAGRETWWRLGRELSAEPTGGIAHMPTAGSFGSDFGLMLAWSRLVGELAGDAADTLVLCDDPWLFRHLNSLGEVIAGPPPPLRLAAWRLGFRGLVSRCRVSLGTALAAIRLKRQRRMMAPGDSVILVYGHPASDADGIDAYFGDLLNRFPGLKRLLHTDCPSGRAVELGVSLHAWGSPLFALGLAFCRWRPTRKQMSGRYGWLIRRAQARENGGGGPAMNRWQMHCQDRWLAQARPSRVAWPWENHGWERNLCRAARNHQVPTIGYQHTVIGPHQFNYAVATNPDGLESVPTIVVADGPAYRNEMKALGVPEERLVIGGAFRFPRFADNLYDPKGPVFVPLSAIPEAAAAQLDAARNLSQQGTHVLVKQHPMYPVGFDKEENLDRSDAALADQKGLSAVLYSSGTSGLEARLMGIPAYRLRFDDRIAIDVLPDGVEAVAVTMETAACEILSGAALPGRVAWDAVLSDPDYGLWQSLLLGDIDGAVAMTNETIKDQ